MGNVRQKSAVEAAATTDKNSNCLERTSRVGFFLLQQMEIKLMRKTVAALITAASIFVPIHASAQGVSGGAERGAREGDRAAGPVGAIVGGTVGAVVGGVAGLLGAEERPRFGHYVVEQHRPSYSYRGDVRVGAELPDAGVTYYDVPPEYGVGEYRYSVVNDRTVLVDPRTHRIVEVVE